MVLLFVGTWTLLMPQVASAQNSAAAWSVVPSSNVRHAQGDPLVGVSCISPTACTAVGTRFYSSRTRTLIESWNGGRWKIVRSPTRRAAIPGWSMVRGPSACAAVGYVLVPSGADQSLIESWNGSAWSIVASPDASFPNNLLNAVSCSDPTSCIAVGYTNNNIRNQTPDPVVERVDMVDRTQPQHVCYE